MTHRPPIDSGRPPSPHVHRPSRFLTIVILGVLAGHSRTTAEPIREEIVARTVVPDTAHPVGEVRLITRGDATVVQTVLRTKLLARVVAEIRDKESRNWPSGVAEYPDMLRYVHALDEAAAALASARTPDGDRRMRLAIEFAATTSTAEVVLAGYDDEGSDAPIAIRSLRVIDTLALRRTYIVRNMRLILADAFHRAASDLSGLGPLGPLADPTLP